MVTTDYDRMTDFFTKKNNEVKFHVHYEICIEF